MKRTKTTAWILCIAMMLSVLAGCGGNSATDSSNTISTVAPGTNNELDTDTSNLEVSSMEAPREDSYHLPIVDEPVTYSLWLTYAPFAADLINTETMEGMLVLDTLQEITNIHFDFTAVNGAAEQDNFNLMIAAGDYTDIINRMRYYSTGLEGAVEEGIIHDLADLLPEKCPTYWSYLSENKNTLMRAYTDSGYMPTVCVLYPELGQEVIGPIVRGDWLDEFGMNTPSTYDDLYAYLKTAKEEKGAIYNFSSSNDLSAGLVSELAYGLNINLGGYEVIDGKVEYGMAQDAFKDYLKFINKLYINKIISQDFFVETSEDLSSAQRMEFGLGTNSLISVGATNTSDILMNVTDENFEMRVIPYVSPDGATAHLGPDTMTDNMKDVDPWAFSTDCDNIEPLLELVEFMFSDEGYLLTNYGVENTTYTLNENGKPEYTGLIINNPDGLSYFFASYVYASNAATGFYPYLNDMSRTFYDFNDNQWQVFEDLKKLSDCAFNYPSYASMTTDESETYTSIESDLTTYMDSRVLEFIVGSADIDAEFNDFVDALYTMGLQDLIDIKQAAYERAMARTEDFGT